MFDELEFLNICLYCGSNTRKFVTNTSECYIDCSCKNCICIYNNCISGLNIKTNKDDGDNGYIITYFDVTRALDISYISFGQWRHHVFELKKFDFELLKLIYHSNADNLIENIKIHLLFS